MPFKIHRKEAVPAPTPSGADARLRERLLEYARRALPSGEFERALSIFWKGRFDPHEKLLILRGGGRVRLP